MCGVGESVGPCDLNVTGLRPPLATRHILCVLLVNNPNELQEKHSILIFFSVEHASGPLSSARRYRPDGVDVPPTRGPFMIELFCPHLHLHPLLHLLAMHA